jgi:hypothetical protein
VNPLAKDFGDSHRNPRIGDVLNGEHMINLGISVTVPEIHGCLPRSLRMPSDIESV